MDQRITDLLPAPVEPTTGVRTVPDNLKVSRYLYVDGRLNLFCMQASGNGNVNFNYYTLDGSYNLELRRPGGAYILTNEYQTRTTYLYDNWRLIQDPAPYKAYVDAYDDALIRRDYLESYVSGATSGATANTTAIQALQAKGGYNRGAFTTSTAYKKNDIAVFNGLIYYANADFTSGAGFVAANWTFMGTIISQDQALMLRLFVVSYDKNYGYDTANSAFNFVNSAGDTCGVVMNGPGFFTSSLTMSAPMFFQGNGNRLSFSNNVSLTMNSGSQGTRLRDCYISVNTDAKIVINSGGVEYTCTSFDNVITQGSNSSVDLGTNGVLALRGNSNIHKVTGSGTLYLFDHSRVVTLDSTVNVIDRRTANTPPGTAIKNAVKGAAASSWVSGELQGTQPTGSVVGMRFVDANYRYEYMSGQNDTTGTQYVWTRTQKV